MIIAWTFVGLMFVVSALSLARIPAGARVAMQWDFRWRVTWRAPRLLAVAFSPVLAVLVLGFMQVLAGARIEAASLIASVIGATFFLVHIVHLYAAIRELDREARAKR